MSIYGRTRNKRANEYVIDVDLMSKPTNTYYIYIDFYLT